MSPPAAPAAAAAVACRHRRRRHVGHLDSRLHHWHVRRGTSQPRANRRCVERRRRSPTRSRRDVGGPGRLLHARRVHHGDPMARRARRPGRRTPRIGAPWLQHHRSQPPAAATAWLALAARLTATSTTAKVSSGQLRSASSCSPYSAAEAGRALVAGDREITALVLTAGTGVFEPALGTRRRIGIPGSLGRGRAPLGAGLVR